MALIDEFKLRYTTQEIVELTNPNSPTGTTIDETFLALAVTDVEAEFEIQGVGVYDNAEPRHVAVAIEGVRARLKTFSRTGGLGGSSSEEWANWLENRCALLAAVTGRKRIDPATTTETTPSDELPEGVDVRRPWADSRRFRDFQALAPYGIDSVNDEAD